LHLYGIIQSRQILDPECATPFCNTSRAEQANVQQKPRLRHVPPKLEVSPSHGFTRQEGTAAICRGTQLIKPACRILLSRETLAARTPNPQMSHDIAGREQKSKARAHEP
jgi:hypothetical protein